MEAGRSGDAGTDRGRDAAYGAERRRVAATGTRRCGGAEQRRVRRPAGRGSSISGHGRIARGTDRMLGQDSGVGKKLENTR